MKRFANISFLAVILVVGVIFSLLLTPASAAEKIIYISDSGSGNGASASSPLGPESTERVANNTDTTLLTDGDPSNDYKYYADRKLYMNSVLYQAAEKLVNTGGKIVLVGDVVLDYSKTYASARTDMRDFYMPDHKNNTITISAQNNARLVMTEGTFLSMGGKTIFENMTFVSKTGRNTGDQCDQNLAICCNGYETVFGEGITCVYENQEGTVVSNPSSKYYLSISGTARYGDKNYDTNVTVKSGTWYRLYGSLYGNTGDIHRGDTNVNISGGSFLGGVFGGARNISIFHIGDVNVNVSGGYFGDSIYVSNSTGASYKNSQAHVTISGGQFGTTRWVKKHFGTLVANGFDANLTVDLSEYQASSVGAIEGDTVYYPAQMTSSVLLMKEPQNSVCFVGEEYDAVGLSAKVTYTNGLSAIIDYKQPDKNFVFSCDSEKEGSAAVYGAYGGKVIAGFSKTVSVIKNPTPSVIGAQISTQNCDAGLRFVAEMPKSADKNLIIKDYGFYAWDKARVSADIVSPDEIYGIDAITANGTHFRAELDGTNYYNDSKKTTFACVYDNIQVCDYNRGIVAVAYVKFSYNGQDYVKYSEPITRSVLGVAQLAVGIDCEKTDWIQKNIIDRYNTFVNDKADKSLAVYNSANAEKKRDIVVSEFRNIANYTWTPSSTVDLTETVSANGTSYYGKYKYNPGTTYYGMAYVANAKADFAQFEKYVKTYKDGTRVYLGPTQGIADFYSSGEPYTHYQSNKYKLDAKYYEIESFFPACDFTGIVVNAWNKVGTNSVWPTTLQSFFPSYGRGVLAVGDYNYSASKSYTDTITTSTGESGMNAAYAQCKRGDVIFCLTTSGRSMYMVMEDVKAGASSVKMMTFSPTLYEVKNSAGTIIGYTHFSEKTFTFKSLYNGGYIPVTIPELASGVQAKTTATVTGFDGEKAFVDGVVNGVLQSNKQILSVSVKLSRFDDNGEFYNETVYCNSVNDQNVNMFDLSCFDFGKYLVNLVEGKTYTLSVSAEIGNEGEKEFVSYKYTKPLTNPDALYASYQVLSNRDFSNLGQSVIDYMKQQMDIYWTPAETFKYANLTGASGFVPNTVFKKGVVYRGICYSNMRATLGEFKSALDTTPTWNSTVGSYVYTMSGVSGTTDWNYVMGNHCSASMYHAYQNVIRLHANSRGNVDMFLVGLEKDLYQGVGAYTNSVIKLYGNEAIYEAYAQAKMGDFVYKRASGGHTRLVQETVVVRDSKTGRIDPKKSYIKMLEQTDTLESEVYGNASNGTTDWSYESTGYDSTWWEHSYSFELLASGNGAAIILRPTELNTGETEQHYVGLTRKATKSNLESTSSNAMGIVESNYPIIGISAIVETSDGAVYKASLRALTGKNVVNVNDLFTSDADTYNAAPDKYLYRPNFAGKKYTYTLTVDLAVGSFVVDSYTAN